MSGEQMPKVDFEKDKVHKYLVDQAKVAEKENIRRYKTFKRVLRSGRIGGAVLTSIVLGIYSYTMVAVKRETFLDDFDEPSMDDEL